MKKILVVLLVLAVATGVFALDGEWSLSGSAEVGTTIDLDPVPGAKADATAIGQGYNRVYDGWGGINGHLGMTYTLDALKLGLEFNNYDGAAVAGTLEYDADIYKFQANTNLSQGIGSSYWYDAHLVDRLWGYYKMVNGLVHLEAAYKSRRNDWWVSDNTAAFNSGAGVTLDDNGDLDWSYGPIATGILGVGGDTFTLVDGARMLLANVELQQLSFGIQLRDLFETSAPVKFIDDVLKKAVLGFTFDMAPIGIAAQFRTGDYGIYFGGKVGLGPVTAGLSFTGILNDPNSDLRSTKFGGSVAYEAENTFGASVKAYYALISSKDPLYDGSLSQIGIVPGFYYNVIPTHLKFQTDFGFYFNGGKANGQKVDTEIAWAIQPQLFWNFLGTGAGNTDTGIIVRYRLVSGDDYLIMPDNNKLDVTFKWNF